MTRDCLSLEISYQGYKDENEMLQEKKRNAKQHNVYTTMTNKGFNGFPLWHIISARRKDSKQRLFCTCQRVIQWES